MADQRRVFDVAHALAVVVDDGHLAAFFQNVLAFHKTRLICIHHDTQGALRNDGQGVLGVDEVILLPALHSASIRLAASVASRRTAMTAGTSQILQMRSTPSAAPMASRSLMR